jgi:hypothetical protein
MRTRSSTIVSELVTRWAAPPDEALTPTRREELQITALPHGTWRVRDSRLPADDLRGLLGFIEKKEKDEVAFEVLTLRRGFEWFSFASFQEAVQDFLEPPRESDRPRTQAESSLSV